ncbi:S8 family serine peptidase [Maridesulfovibrio sp.]|uniref:S8 family serine peptidase n=1 Tax=Maridesulfovibrio sp. TaxID=2795000 RepID=UPI002A1885AA|nr:S8 family serine peptidase [Maridesulfovibrio sp.]
MSKKTQSSSVKSGATSSASKVSPSTRLLFSSATIVEEYDYYVVQFSGPVQSAWKESISDQGVVFYDYIPQYAFIIKLGTAKVSAVEDLSFVRWLGKYEADLKLSSDVYDITPGKLKEQGSLLDVRVVAFPGEDVNSLEQEIRSAGGAVLSSSSSEWSVQLEVRISIQEVGGLKDIKGVKWIEKAPEHRTDNNIAVGIIEARSVQDKVWPVSGSKLFGNGQIVAVCDSGIDTGDVDNLHEDFSDGQGGSRIVSNSVFSGASIKDCSGHGTHVAGIIAGNGIKSGSSPVENNFPSSCYAGIAPKTQLYVQSVGADDGSSRLPGIPSDLANLFKPAFDAGARIHSNSWGTSGVGDYSSESVSVDQFMWSNKDFLILFAAGNAGYDKDQDGIVDIYCIDTPATAKNCLSVGASESYRTGSKEGFAVRNWGEFRTYADPVGSDPTSDKPYGVAAFSSRGPTIDGRYKPEVIAPGTNLLSTRSSAQLGNGWGAFNDDYYWSGGTSMATPLVSGTAAIFREYLIKEESITDPSAALIKTGLIHGAVSLAPGQYGTEAAQELHDAPDDAQGWGRVNLEASVNSDAQYKVEYHDIKDSAPSDDSYLRNFTFEVENDGKPFKATLGWTDYPGSSAVGGGLVNDLDLRVKQPDGTWVYPDNAVSLSPLTKYLYVTSVSGMYKGSAIGVRVTPPSYPATLESVILAFSNSASVAEEVSIVVYRYDGGVGDEIFRKSFAYIPSGEYALPVGVTIADGSVVVAVEKSGSLSGVYCQVGNPTTRGLVKVGGVWQEAAITPGMGVTFRTKVAATSFDRLNNTVSVTIDKPQKGTYTAEISAYNIPVGPQPYALVMSAMAGDTPTAGEIELNIDQPDAPTSTFLSKTRATRTAENVNSVYGTAFNNVYSDQSAFCVQTQADGLISIRYAATGLPQVKADELTLAKLFNNGTNMQFNYAGFEDYKDGNWWLTDVAGKFVDPVRALNATASYYIVSVIKDGGPYDENPEPGVIDDPQILGMNRAGGSGTGCTIGMNDEYSPLFLVIIALGSLFIRLRRNSR